LKPAAEPQLASHFVVRREPSLASFIWTLGGWVCPSEQARPLISKEGSDMRAHRIFLSLAILAACGITCQTSAVLQEYRGTLQQQMACTPDVFRLCGEQIPDVNRIVACLRQNTPQLSGPCRAVFESSASSAQQGVPQQAAPRPRDFQ
jgi:hypothetical protein